MSLLWMPGSTRYQWRIGYQWLIGSWLLWFASTSACWAEASPRVLLLNSYHPQYQWTSELTRGVQDTLSERVPSESVYIEYLDARRFMEDQALFSLFRQLLQYKYQHNQPDVIISSDDSALQFLLHHGEELFPGRPVVFSGISLWQPQWRGNHRNITGLLEEFELGGNLRLIAQLQPQLQRVVILSDASAVSQMLRQKIDQEIQQLPDTAPYRHLDIQVREQFSLDALQEEMATADDRSAFLLLSLHRDNAGNYFSYNDDLPRLAQASQAPIYGMLDGLQIGSGVLGGLVNDPYEHGREAAVMALEILNGTPASDLAIKTGSSLRPQFDQRLLERFNIDRGRLPADARLHNRPSSLYQDYRLEVSLAVALLLLLLSIVGLLSFNIHRRHQIESQLKELNMSLEDQILQRTLILHEKNNALQKLSRKLNFYAHTDTLTGLANRRSGEKHLRATFQRHQQGGGQFALAILDLDNFKQINDRLGHDKGDEVLMLVSQCLKERVRPTDAIFRWGGEEFLLVLHDLDQTEALSSCERLRQAVERLIVPGFPPLTLSIGLCSYPGKQQLEDMLRHADAALYRAKEEGKNRVETCRDSQSGKEPEKDS